jgi:hypothetical protein
MADLTGDLLTLRYVTLDQALAWRWDDNPKKHDLDGLAASIQAHGFRDPSLYDSTLPGIPAGNGRLAALDQLRSTGDSAPRGIGLDADGVWHVPVIFGVDAPSQTAALQFGIDHNNLTVVGFTPEEVSRLWQTEDYLALLQRLDEAEALPVTVGSEALQDLLAAAAGFDNNAPGDPGEERYREQYGVIVLCDDETHQEQVYNTLMQQGYECRVVVT